MKKVIGIFIVIFTFFSCGQTTNERSYLQSTVEYLASDALQGRETGSEGEKLAVEFIESEFKRLGLKESGEDNSYLQEFSFKPHPPIQKHHVGDSTTLGMAVVKEMKGINVIGLLDNEGDQTIVIGAHHDHLGMGDENSLFMGEDEIHNGADDNASGVSALLLLAHRLSDQNLNHDFLFISFSGEEKGLYGSNYFIDNPTIDLENVNFMINMDMVGRMKSDSALAVYGTGTSPVWEELVNTQNSDSLNLVFHESGVGPSDHTSFYLADIPVLHMFTGQHSDYHKPSDDADKINYDGILKVADFIERIIENLDSEEPIEFTKTKDQTKDDTPRFNVTLGVIPDYMFDGEGMRIDGVSEGRPAHNAGIIKGDIVVKMGEHAVTDMYTYMECLGKFNPNETTVVIANRNGAEISFNVVWD